MQPIRKITAAAAIATLLTLTACGTVDNRPNSTSQSTYPSSNSQYAQYGIVESMQMVQQSNGIGGSGIGAGAIIGAVVGGVLGNQVGKGGGNTAATVLGAAGGAYAGNQVEKSRSNSGNAVQMVIRLGDGSRVTVTQESSADIRVGDRVMVNNGIARLY